jgi:aminomethyltransferase
MSLLKTPFHERLEPLNETGLWEHWSGYLTATKYQMSEKFEYVAVRDAAAIFDSSPLYKYRFSGPDAERFLAGVLLRDPAAIAPGQAQYQLWCDDRGMVVEDGVLMRLGPDEFTLTAAEPNLDYFARLVGRRDEVAIEEITADWGVLAFQGPRSRRLLAGIAPDMESLPYFGLVQTTIAKVPVVISRTGYTGDLGYEIWVPADGALKVWDELWKATRGYNVIPFGQTALSMARIEAGLVLLDVDFHNARFAWTDADRVSAIELGFGWMLRDIETTSREFLGRDALRRELREKSSRWKLTGLMVDWREYDRIFEAGGLVPPKDHTPIHDEYYIYDDEGKQLGYATSQMYSPRLQRHIALARVPLDRQAPGSRVRLELAVNHRYEYFDAYVTRLPLYNPPRKTAP